MSKTSCLFRYINYWYQNINVSAPPSCSNSPTWGLSGIVPAWTCLPGNAEGTAYANSPWQSGIQATAPTSFEFNYIADTPSLDPESLCRYSGGTEWLGYSRSVPPNVCQYKQLISGCTAAEVCPISAYDYNQDHGNTTMLQAMQAWNAANGPTSDECDAAECFVPASSSAFGRCTTITTNITSELPVPRTASYEACR